MRNFLTLLRMQLRDKSDFSFLRSPRAAILKIGVAVLLFAGITYALKFVFSMCVSLSIFSFTGGLPETVMTVLFTGIMLIGIYSCTTGLRRELYSSGDNAMLLTMPAKVNTVFLSKLAVFYVFELKRNFTVTVPLYVAYGLVNGAVKYYYLWMLVCFLFVSMLPVAIGAVLSIPAFYIPKFLSAVPAIKYLLRVAILALVAYGAFSLVALIPGNINLLGQWGLITKSVRDFLNAFARYAAPFHYMNKMMVGGTIEISRRLFSGETFIVFAALTGIIAALVAVAFFTSGLLFVKMTARGDSVTLGGSKAVPNRVHGVFTGLFGEDLKRNLRDGSYIPTLFFMLVLPPFVIFALNKIYAAMATSFSGRAMTMMFNILVLLVTVLTANAPLADVYSRDGAARQLLKTRPVDMRMALFVRLIVRMAVSTAAIVACTVIYSIQSGATVKMTVGFTLMSVFVCAAHIFWCAEMDVMNPRPGPDSPGTNVTKATAAGIALAFLFAVAFNLISGSGAASAFVKLAVVAFVFLAVRAYLYFARVRAYFTEK